MATLEALAYKRMRAIERIEAATTRLAEKFDIEPTTMHASGHDPLSVQAAILDKVATYLESVVDKIAPTKIVNETPAEDSENVPPPAEDRLKASSGKSIKSSK